TRVRGSAIHPPPAARQTRAKRDTLARLTTPTVGGENRRTIYDANHLESDPPQGVRVRGEDDAPISDTAVNEAFDGLGTTYDFYKQVFSRNSLDGNGLRLDGIVHYGDGFNNAFWDGQGMGFGGS